MDKERQLHFMQIRMIRAAAEKWGKDYPEVVTLMARYGVFKYIEDCFGVFHVQGDPAVLDEIEDYLRDRGAAYD